MKNLDINTVKLLLREDYELNKKKIWIVLSVVAGLCFAITSFFGFKYRILGISKETEKSMEVLSSTFNWNFSALQIEAVNSFEYSQFVFYIALLLVASSAFSNLSEKSGDIDFLTIKASNLEKWTSKISYVLLFCLAVYVAYMAGIVLSGLMGYVFYPKYSAALWPFFNSFEIYKMLGINYSPFLLESSSRLAALGTLFAMIYGSIVFRRHAWLINAACFVVLLIMFIFGFGAIGGYVGYHAAVTGKELNMPKMLSEFMNIALNIGVAVAYTFFLIGSILLRKSYTTFCHRQLEMRKIKRIKK